MKVTDWYKWTRFKKRAGITLVSIGIFLSFGMENGSMSYGVWGLIVAGAGLAITQTIRTNEW
jgi:hypothetical protein